MAQTKCDQCGKYFEIIPYGDQFFLRRIDSDMGSERLCSISCLTAKAWELREQQPKLSKSRN
jgi:hypothetical protein